MLDSKEIYKNFLMQAFNLRRFSDNEDNAMEEFKKIVDIKEMVK